MNAVNENHWIIFLQRTGKPAGDIFVDIFYHTGDAGLAVVFTIDFVEDLTNLTLGKALSVQAACKTLTLFLLIAQDGQYLRMKIAVPVARYPEFQTLAMTICMSNAVAVTLVAVLAFTEETAPLGQHQALQHYLHQIVQAVFSLCMLAH